MPCASYQCTSAKRIVPSERLTLATPFSFLQRPLPKRAWRLRNSLMFLPTAKVSILVILPTISKSSAIAIGVKPKVESGHPAWFYLDCAPRAWTVQIWILGKLSSTTSATRSATCPTDTRSLGVSIRLTSCRRPNGNRTMLVNLLALVVILRMKLPVRPGDELSCFVSLESFV
jgi:hypothetical protein